MATGINLLPQGKALKGQDKVLVESISKLTLIGLIIFIAAILVVGVYFVYSSLRLRSSISAEETLKAEVEALANTEQSFYLVKDRVSKVKTILAKASTNEQTEKLAGFLENSTQELSLTEIQLTSQKVILSLVFPSSSSFGVFYKSLVDSGIYKTITLKSLNFSQLVGYLATLELTNE